MTLGTRVAGFAVVAMLAAGCDPTARYKVLSFFFDGVPPPGATETADGKAAAGKQAAATENAAQAQRSRPTVHGPYAAKQCNACHESAATNSLVVPREQLCFECHEFRVDKKYVHGPLASGGCLACHDPHSSRYGYLLIAESDSFCLHCHAQQDVARNTAHAGVEGQCTDCHDAHMSNKKYLLK